MSSGFSCPVGLRKIIRKAISLEGFLLGPSVRGMTLGLDVTLKLEINSVPKYSSN